jgi:hypothetical protein
MPQPETLPTPSTLRGDDVDQILPELLKFGGGASLASLAIYAVFKEWIVIGVAHRREVADIASQRDRAEDRNERLLDTNAELAETLRELAHKDDLSTYAVEALKREVLDKSGGDGS